MEKLNVIKWEYGVYLEARRVGGFHKAIVGIYQSARRGKVLKVYTSGIKELKCIKDSPS